MMKIPTTLPISHRYSPSVVPNQSAKPATISNTIIFSPALELKNDSLRITGDTKNNTIN